MAQPVRILFTDLDGTLLDSNKKLSEENRRSLLELGARGVIRVIATGRSIFSYRRLPVAPIPVDYLIFSTGVGIYDLKGDRLLYSADMPGDDVCSITGCLMEEKVDFMVHREVPENHHFLYWGNTAANPDFSRRIELYGEYAHPLIGMNQLPHRSAQIIAILGDDLQRFTQVAKRLQAFQVTRTTSPLDSRSIWMEIQPARVDKGASAAWLCRHLGIERSATCAVGNDYNDLSLLQYAAHSFMVANAPVDLGDFIEVPGNDANGFSHAARKILAAARGGA